jgi:hypothetical protein
VAALRVEEKDALTLELKSSTQFLRSQGVINCDSFDVPGSC